MKTSWIPFLQLSTRVEYLKFLTKIVIVNFPVVGATASYVTVIICTFPESTWIHDSWKFSHFSINKSKVSEVFLSENFATSQKPNRHFNSYYHYWQKGPNVSKNATNKYSDYLNIDFTSRLSTSEARNSLTTGKTIISFSWIFNRNRENYSTNQKIPSKETFNIYCPRNNRLRPIRWRRTN